MHGPGTGITLLLTNMKMTKVSFSLLALAALFALLLVACGDGDAGLSCAEVEEIVREELADAPAPTQPEPELTAPDVEEAIRAAMADIPQQEPGLSKEEIERIVEAAIATIATPQPGLTSAQVGPSPAFTPMGWRRPWPTTTTPTALTPSGTSL